MAREHGQILEDDEPPDPADEARRRAALAQIRQYGDPSLRLKAREVTIFDDELHRLADRMTALMRDAHGVGLAGTQVGVLQRLLVLQPSPDEEALALVNPRLLDASDERAVDQEGCLSLQGVLVPVERATAVTIEAQNLDGETIRLDLEEFAARVAQHELDHLDGVLILDRTPPEHRREALARLRPRIVLA